MITFILTFINGFTKLLERAAAYEQKKTEASLRKASAMVDRANAQRKAAQFARKVSAGLKDIQG